MSKIINDIDLFYDKNTKFVISPVMDNKTIEEFSNYLSFVNKLNYTGIPDDSTNSSEKYNNTNFWIFDENFNIVKTNESTDIVRRDIFNQLVTIYYWLYYKGYRMKGTTYYRTNNVIEYISMDSLISHYVLFDGMDFYHNMLKFDSKEMLMFDSKKKILSALGLKDSWPVLEEQSSGWHPSWTPIVKSNNNSSHYDYINPRKKYIRKKLSQKKINKIKFEEQQTVIKLLHERLDQNENKINSLINTNRLLWKICTVITLFTGSYVLYWSFTYDSNFHYK